MERRRREEKAMIFNSLFTVSKASELCVNSSASVLAKKHLCLYRRNYGEVNALKKHQRTLRGPHAGQPAQSLTAFTASEIPDCSHAGLMSPVPSHPV